MTTMTAPTFAPAASATGDEFLPRGGCHPDPYVELAVDVINSALRDLRKWWKEVPIDEQPQSAQEALAFLVFGLEGPMPFLYHELVGLESLSDLPPQQRISLMLKARLAVS